MFGGWGGGGGGHPEAVFEWYPCMLEVCTVASHDIR